MSVVVSNLFAGLPVLDGAEQFDVLARCRNVMVERILSPAMDERRSDIQRYDQPQDEWVLLLSGEATLEIGSHRTALAAGDYVFIPAHTPHRVLQTSAEPRCIWLAVHIEPNAVAADPP